MSSGRLSATEVASLRSFNIPTAGQTGVVVIKEDTGARLLVHGRTGALWLLVRSGTLSRFSEISSAGKYSPSAALSAGQRSSCLSQLSGDETSVKLRDEHRLHTSAPKFQNITNVIVHVQKKTL